MVGANPGGAGKTTVMGALLNLVPDGVDLVAADSADVIDRGRSEGRRPRGCYVCHEIGDGPYYAYLWGDALRGYFDLPVAGHMLATNLHADTLEQARSQVCGDNAVSEEAFRRMNLALFLRMERMGRRVGRRIVDVWESDGRREHQPILRNGETRLPVESSCLVSEENHARGGRWVDALLGSGARTIRDVRAFVTRNGS
jgi:hypothetical protein